MGNQNNKIKQAYILSFLLTVFFISCSVQKEIPTGQDFSRKIILESEDSITYILNAEYILKKIEDDNLRSLITESFEENNEYRCALSISECKRIYPKLVKSIKKGECGIIYKDRTILKVVNIVKVKQKCPNAIFADSKGIEIRHIESGYVIWSNLERKMINCF